MPQHSSTQTTGYAYQNQRFRLLVGNTFEHLQKGSSVVTMIMKLFYLLGYVESSGF